MKTEQEIRERLRELRKKKMLIKDNDEIMEILEKMVELEWVLE